MTQAEVLLRSLFDGDLPCRDAYVLADGVYVVPPSSDDLDAGWWPEEIGADAGGKARIDRRTLFDVAARAGGQHDERSGLQLCAGVMAWADGAAGVSLQDRMSDLARSDGAAVMTSLLSSLRVDGPERAYSLIAPYQRLLTEDGSDGFHTMLLYFGGYELSGERVKPLIMDDGTVAAMRWLTREPWSNTSRTSYIRYLYRVDQWASTLGTASDVVQRRLSDKGKEIRNGAMAGLSPRENDSRPIGFRA